MANMPKAFRKKFAIKLHLMQDRNPKKLCNKPKNIWIFIRTNWFFHSFKTKIFWLGQPRLISLNKYLSRNVFEYTKAPNFQIRELHINQVIKCLISIIYAFWYEQTWKMIYIDMTNLKTTIKWWDVTSLQHGFNI